MAIQLYTRPSDRNWSGNPIHYYLYSAEAAADDTIIFEIKILFKRTDAIAYSEILTLPFNPVNGSVHIDVQDVLDGLMDYETPGISSDNEFASPLFCRKMTGQFYINWREITEAAPDPAFVTTENAFPRFVIKGGIAFHKWRGDNYWINYWDPLKPFLTWQQSGRLASQGERMYLAWLNMTALDPAILKMRRIVTFTDGTSYQYDHNYPANQHEVVFFPAGATQLELQEVYPTKKIHYWTLQVWNIQDGIPLSQLFKYELDNRNDYNGVTLNYRNSLGGLDSVRIRGVIDYNTTREFTEQAQVVMHDYFLGAGSSIKGRVKPANSTELLVYAGNVGPVGKEEQDRLRDIHFQREVWWEQQKKWLPVMTMTGSQKIRSSEDDMWNLVIEFSIASGGDRYHTPDSINLAEGTDPNVLACNAIISPLSYVFNNPGWTINWSLVSGAPVKYHVSTPGVSGGAPGETITTSYFFPWLPEGDNEIKVQPICEIGGVFYLGAPQYITITVAPACTPVGISGAPVLPDGQIGVAYNYSFDLTGTAPFVLANIIKPSWMTIVISANQVVFGGTPGAGASGENIEVTFDVKNCSDNNFVPFSQTIDIPSNFEVKNLVSGATDWLIEDVVPAFYLISLGTYPLLSGEILTGDQGGYNGVITVKLTQLSGLATLNLYVNAVLTETINAVATGNHNFTSRNYLVSDSIKIELVNT